ncbi:hypothetical protein CDN99_25235 [Roseateles aquatilis]|uniref:HTH araC/xylS-type domain-containing protein n=1 Tax=Roseateles aquatilis TaxID=431061 RepID=A0A246IU82_9BURK|nr:AraC family transcriptional regulator [Roseateles aquatilis]OWQ83775.1 hypothetical protein CDN99_25235 [Roseateles aquatilis]
MPSLNAKQADASIDTEACLPLQRRLGEQVVRHLPRPGDHLSQVPGLSFYRRDEACTPACTLLEPSLSVMVQGRTRVILGSEVYEYDAGQFMLTSVDLPTITQILGGSESHPVLSLLLKLDLDIVREVAGDIDLHKMPVESDGSAMTLGRITSELLDPVVRLVSLADKTKDIPIVAPLISREIIYRLLTGHVGGQLRNIAMFGTKHYRIAEVITWLREHYAQPVKVETLAQMAAMGVSTFHHHFRAITRMSPLQYQKQVRLHEARKLLLTEALDAGTAAFRVGYESVTQFNREYRRAFGNPPIRDISLLLGH